jgi:hypothetical protein
MTAGFLDQPRSRPRHRPFLTRMSRRVATCGTDPGSGRTSPTPWSVSSN